MELLNKIKNNRIAVILIISAIIVIIPIGYLIKFETIGIGDSEQLGKTKTHQLENESNVPVSDAEDETDLSIPQLYSIYINNMDSKVKDVFVSYKNNNKNDIMISSFDKVLNAISKASVKYSKEGKEIVFCNGDNRLIFEVESAEYTTTKMSGKMRYPVESIDDNIYFPLSELVFLFNYELDIPMSGLNIRPYPERKVIHFVTYDHLNDNDIFSE